MAFELRKAERKKAKLRIGLFGPSGSGKTFSALKLAHGMASAWDKIAIIDTEHESADLYCHLGDYNVLPLKPPYSPERYIEAIKACDAAGMEVIIIDSITHEWEGDGGCLEIVDALSKGAKNSYTVWGRVTPRHNNFINAILGARAHVVCCGRTKVNYAINEVEKNGKKISVPEKIGLKAITREGFDYEMTISFEVAINHHVTTAKDRTGIFMDQPEFVISEETGKTILEWNATGADAPASPPPPAPAVQKQATQVSKPSNPQPAPAAPLPSVEDIKKIEELMAELDVPYEARQKTRSMLRTAADAEKILSRLCEKLREQIEGTGEDAAPEPSVAPEEPPTEAEAVPEAPATAEDAQEAAGGNEEARKLMEEVKALLVPSTSKTPLMQLEEVFARYCGKDVKPDKATLTQWQLVKKMLEGKRKEQEAATKAAA